MYKLQNLFSFFSLIGLCSTVLAAECSIDNTTRTIYMDKAPGIVFYNFYNCKKVITSSQYQWLDTKDRNIIFKSSTYPQNPVPVLHTNQNFTIMGWGSIDHWGTPDELSYTINYPKNYNVRDVEYNIMMGKHLLPSLAYYQPGEYSTSVKLSVNY